MNAPFLFHMVLGIRLVATQHCICFFRDEQIRSSVQPYGTEIQTRRGQRDLDCRERAGMISRCASTGAEQSIMFLQGRSRTTSGSMIRETWGLERVMLQTE